MGALAFTRNQRHNQPVAPHDVRQPSVLDDAWAQLSARRWAEARVSFERALAHEASAEAYEGLSWAAWWLDDAKCVLEAREQAFRAYRDAEDSASAARMAIWVAADQLDFNGALATASGWLERAERLLGPAGAAKERGWLAFHQGYIASIRGEPRQAELHGAEAARLGRATKLADLEMLGLALEGLSLVSRAEVARGMRCIEEAAAIALAGEASIPISSAWTYCFMVTACTRVLDFARAYEWCDHIAEFAGRYGSRYLLGYCRSEYATIYLWRGRWQEAERALEEAIAALAVSRPTLQPGPLAELSELRRRQGRVDEALELLGRAGNSSKAQLCRGRLALDAGNARLALELGERVRRGLSEERPVDCVPALELLVRAHLALGSVDSAGDALDALASITERAGTPGLRARRCLFQGMVDAARGEHDVAQRWLEDALDGFEHCGAPFDAACARVELALSLLALGRLDQARREGSLARARLLELGARVAAARAEPILGPDAAVEQASSFPLSRREAEVLRLLVGGKTNRELARELCISEHTVHRHVTSILRKLDLPSRTAAATWALRNGIALRQ